MRVKVTGSISAGRRGAQVTRRGMQSRARPFRIQAFGVPCPNRCSDFASLPLNDQQRAIKKITRTKNVRPAQIAHQTVITSDGGGQKLGMFAMRITAACQKTISEMAIPFAGRIERVE